MAQGGGIGIIHKNMPPEMQARRLKVKRHESGVVKTRNRCTDDAHPRSLGNAGAQQTQNVRPARR